MKFCTKCSTDKAATEFYKDKTKKDGLHNYCKSCQSVIKARWSATSAARESRKKWREDNRDKMRKYNAAWRLRDPDASRESVRKSKQANPHKVRAQTAGRRAHKILATPVWADLSAIRSVYENCPPGYHVDHIVPLNGQYVCGLHVHYNLQHLPAAENCSKGNRLLPQYEEAA